MSITKPYNSLFPSDLQNVMVEAQQKQFTKFGVPDLEPETKLFKVI